MKDTPILMCGEMVRATLREREPKTQTRRVIKHQRAVDSPWPDDSSHITLLDLHAAPAYYSECGWCPYGKAGDRLWVKETAIIAPKRFADDPDGTCIRDADGDPRFVQYVATHPNTEAAGWYKLKKTPSIFMPRWASRISLEIAAVRVERVQAISVEDATAEGLDALTKDNGRTWKYGIAAPDGLPATEEEANHGAWPWHLWRQSPVDAYQYLWNDINLAPSALYARDEAGKKVIVGYQSFPWSDEDFDTRYPGVRANGVFRGKPITVRGNPWVWVISFKRVEERAGARPSGIAQKGGR